MKCSKNKLNSELIFIFIGIQMEARFSNNASYFCGEVEKIVLIDGENMLFNKKWHNWWNYRILQCKQWLRNV